MYYRKFLPGNKVPHKAFSTYNDLKAVRKLCGRLDWIRLDSGFVGREMLDFLDDFSYQGNSEKKVKYIVNTGMGCIGAKKAKRLSRFREWIFELARESSFKITVFVKYSEAIKRFVDCCLSKAIFLEEKAKENGNIMLYVQAKIVLPLQFYIIFTIERQTIENFFDEAKNDYYYRASSMQKTHGK